MVVVVGLGVGLARDGGVGQSGGNVGDGGVSGGNVLNGSRHLGLGDENWETAKGFGGCCKVDVDLSLG